MQEIYNKMMVYTKELKSLLKEAIKRKDRKYQGKIGIQYIKGRYDPTKDDGVLNIFKNLL
ncbi:MAG: hypothetical protein ACTSVI_00040 [Promethearchaeota archaeon]